MDPASLGMLVLIGTVALGAVGGAIWWNAHESEKRRRIWSEVAREKGGTFFEGHAGMFTYESPAVEARVEHAVARLGLHIVGSGKNRQVFTRVRARYALGAGPIFQVYREGILQSVGKALGAQDVELGGDEAFDAHFVVKCDDAAAMRGAWPPAIKARMLRHFGADRASADGAEVTLSVGGGVVDPAKLHAMLELVGALASAGTERLADYAALEGAELRPGGGTYDAPVPPRLRFATARGEVQAELLPGIGEPRLRLRIAHDRELPAFSVDLEEGAAPGLPRGLVSEIAQEILRRLRDGITIAGDRSGLQVTWRAAPSPEVLVEGVRLITELAGGTPTEGAFR